MFEDLKKRMVLNESKKIQNESLELLVEDEEFLDDDIEAVIDDKSDDKGIEVLVDNIPDDDVINDEDISNEMAILESLDKELDDDDLDSEIAGFDVTKEKSPFSFEDDDLNEAFSYLESDEVTGDTQEEIEDQTTSDDSFHESTISNYLEDDDLTVDDDLDSEIAGFDVTKEKSPFSFESDDLDLEF